MGSVALANRLDSIQRNLLTKTDIIATLITKVQRVSQSRAALLANAVVDRLFQAWTLPSSSSDRALKQ